MHPDAQIRAETGSEPLVNLGHGQISNYKNSYTIGTDWYNSMIFNIRIFDN